MPWGKLLDSGPIRVEGRILRASRAKNPMRYPQNPPLNEKGGREGQPTEAMTSVILSRKASTWASS